MTLTSGTRSIVRRTCSSEFAKIADGLHIDLLAFDFIAGFFLNGSCHILRGDGAIQFASLTSLGSKDQGQPIDLVGKVLEFRILFGAANFSLANGSFQSA